MKRTIGGLACITGDVHQPLHSSGYLNEVSFLKRYVEIADSYDVKLTIFATGKCVTENVKYFREIAKRDNIELGGHTYSAFRPLLLHNIFQVLFRDYYGPKIYKKYDVLRTVKVFREIGVNLKVWRTHGYKGDPVLYSLLSNAGIEIVSDAITIGFPQIYREHGLWQVPITMPPDDEIFKAVINGEKEKICRWKSNFKSVLQNEISKGKDIIIQFHPVIQGIIDNFHLFHYTLKMLKKGNYTFLTLSEYVRSVFDV